ncbi:MAG: hypothetical protein HOU01_12550, partial [Streptomycetaceae bacterium]|nr:hypothetical protein [Streptomycetaceae bacterium]
MALPKITTIPRKAAATAAVLALGGAGLVALAPAAGAATVSLTMNCRNPIFPDRVVTQDITVDFNPATVPPGGSVRAEVTLGPLDYPVPVNMPDLAIRVSLGLQMRGGAAGSATVSGADRVGLGQNQPISIRPFVGSFVLPADSSGQVDFAVAGLKIEADFGPVVDCSTTAGGEQSVGSVTADGTTAEPAALSVVTPEVRPGGPVQVAGTHYTPLATPTEMLCGLGGANCVPV